MFIVHLRHQVKALGTRKTKTKTSLVVFLVVLVASYCNWVISRCHFVTVHLGHRVTDGSISAGNQPNQCYSSGPLL